MIASVVPGAPDRSMLNSVVYRDAEALAAALDELAAAYEAAGRRRLDGLGAGGRPRRGGAPRGGGTPARRDADGDGRRPRRASTSQTPDDLDWDADAAARRRDPDQRPRLRLARWAPSARAMTRVPARSRAAPLPGARRRRARRACSARSTTATTAASTSSPRCAEHRGRGLAAPASPRGPGRGPRARPADLEPPGDQGRLSGLRAARLRADLRARDVGAPRVTAPE